MLPLSTSIWYRDGDRDVHAIVVGKYRSGIDGIMYHVVHDDGTVAIVSAWCVI